MSSIVYVTGVPGAGKSAVRRELRRRGLVAVGVDEDHVGAFHTADGRAIPDGEIVDDPTWRQHHEWRIVPDRIDLITQAGTDIVYLCGSAANEGDVWKRFAAVVALVLDDNTLRQRLATRTGNNFGKSADELDRALGWNRTYAVDMHSYGAITIDATRMLSNVVDDIIALTTPHTRSPE